MNRRFFLAGTASLLGHSSFFAAIAAPPAAFAASRLRLAATTTLESSGMLSHLLSAMRRDNPDLDVQAIIAGSGTVLRYAANGDVDAAIAHSREDELQLEAAGVLIGRAEFMYNRFMIAGPRSDPASAAEASDAVDAFLRIFRSRRPFLSRGDFSGTHRRELSLWKEAGIDPRRDLDAYQETGSGMGATLNIAAERDAYTLMDEGSWANFKGRGGLAPLFAQDARFVNVYAVSRVADAIDGEGAERFRRWLISDRGRAAVDSYRIGGKQVFFSIKPESGDAASDTAETGTAK